MKKKYKIPGMFHPLKLVFKPGDTLGHEENERTLGTYDHTRGEIELIDKLTPHIKRHTLYHELAHHIINTLADMNNEEDKCDVLASYLIRLAKNNSRIIKKLK